MKPLKPVDLKVAIRTFESIKELATAGALAEANALYQEHIGNPFGRFSLDIDLQNQTEDIEAIHRRFSLETKKKLKLVSRLSAEMYEYEVRIARQIVRVEIARPYLRHRRNYQVSKHVSDLLVVSLADLMFAKISAFSTRGFARDLIYLFAIDQQKKIDWQTLLTQAGRAADNDYNPAEFHRKLQWHHRECAKTSYVKELPVTNPAPAATLRQFVKRLLDANAAVSQQSLI